MERNDHALNKQCYLFNIGVVNDCIRLMKFIDKHAFATREESAALGASDMMLSRLVACTRYSDAVICGVSALT